MTMCLAEFDCKKCTISSAFKTVSVKEKLLSWTNVDPQDGWQTLKACLVQDEPIASEGWASFSFQLQR